MALSQLIHRWADSTRSGYARSTSPVAVGKPLPGSHHLWVIYPWELSSWNEGIW